MSLEPIQDSASPPCRSLVQLNISWCPFTNDHVRSVVNSLSPSVTHLNLSGYRENLTLDGK